MEAGQRVSDARGASSPIDIDADVTPGVCRMAVVLPRRLCERVRIFVMRGVGMKRVRSLQGFLCAAVGVAAMLAATAVASAAVPASAYSALRWRQIGPFRGGRSLAVAGNPATPSTFYAGYTGGGIWKTTDNGEHWSMLTGKDFAFGDR